MPLYLNHKGISDAGIGFWMALMVSSGIIGQWPIGRLADRFGRLLVLRVQVFVVILGCFAMLSNAAMAPALFVLGTAGFTLYPVAMAWACEKVEYHQLVAMNQALLLSYTVGSLSGPTLTAMLMQSYSDSLLFIMIASVSFIYLLMLMRKVVSIQRQWRMPDVKPACAGFFSLQMKILHYGSCPYCDPSNTSDILRLDSL
jgi:UMF2 family putative MFS family transporter